MTYKQLIEWALCQPDPINTVDVAIYKKKHSYRALFEFPSLQEMVKAREEIINIIADRILLDE